MADGELSKGIFWFTCSFAGEDEECDFSDTEIIAMPVPCDSEGRPKKGDMNFNSRKGDSFTHKETWSLLAGKRKELRRRPWNYFPRGRVEIGGNKAIIFINPHIASCGSFKEMVESTFHLEEIEVKVVIDSSKHYYCHGDDRRI